MSRQWTYTIGERPRTNGGSRTCCYSLHHSPLLPSLTLGTPPTPPLPHLGYPSHSSPSLILGTPPAPPPPSPCIPLPPPPSLTLHTPPTPPAPSCGGRPTRTSARTWPAQLFGCSLCVAEGHGMLQTGPQTESQTGSHLQLGLEPLPSGGWSE